MVRQLCGATAHGISPGRHVEMMQLAKISLAGKIGTGTYNPFSHRQASLTWTWREFWWQPRHGSHQSLGPPGLGSSRTKLRREQRKRQLERLQRIALQLCGSTAEGVNSSGVHSTEKHDKVVDKGTQTSTLAVRKDAQLTFKELMEMAKETCRRIPHILEPPRVLLAIKDAPLEARCPEDISEQANAGIGVDVKFGAVGLTSSQTRRGHLVEPCIVKGENELASEVSKLESIRRDILSYMDARGAAREIDVML